LGARAKHALGTREARAFACFNEHPLVNIKLNGGFSRMPNQVVTMTLNYVSKPVPNRKSRNLKTAVALDRRLPNRRFTKPRLHQVLDLNLAALTLNNFYNCNLKFHFHRSEIREIEILATQSIERMPPVCHQLKEFSFKRLKNGSVQIQDATIESIRLGMVPSQFLIHVEYYNITSDVLIEVGSHQLSRAQV